MALSRSEKEQIIEVYTDKLGRAGVLVWANFQGVTVEQSQGIRAQLRQADAEQMVVKNTLMRVALERAGLPHSPEVMDGPCVVTFSYGDVAPAVKALTDFARENEGLLTVKGGIIGGELADAGMMRQLADLPPREVLVARVVGGIAAPLSGFVGTLNAMVSGLVNVLSARREQLEGAAS